jgi:hypothetical protein
VSLSLYSRVFCFCFNRLSFCGSSSSSTPRPVSVLHYLVKEVILPDMFDDFDGSETLCLAFERGKGKDLTYTDEKKISLSDNDEIVADFNKESLTCDVTLHRDNKTGLFRVRKFNLLFLLPFSIFFPIILWVLSLFLFFRRNRGVFLCYKENMEQVHPLKNHLKHLVSLIFHFMNILMENHMIVFLFLVVG